MQYTIEKNIPIDSNNLSEMEIGDSVLVDTHKEANSVCAYLARAGFRGTQRVQPSRQYRVWKQEAKVIAPKIN